MKNSGTMRLPGDVPMQPPLPPDWSHVTTVMMRNLPNKYTQRMLLTEVNQSGFLGTIDFFYLPIDNETDANRGYGFLNFIAPYYAWTFRNMFEGRRMSRFNSAKFVSVTPATLQGFQANYAHYSSARVNRGDPSARPLFLREPSPEFLWEAQAKGPTNNTKEKSNTKGRQRKGKPQTAETLNMPPKARLDKKSIDAGNYQQHYNQYQHQQGSSEATTTAQDSQESTETQSFESQESQSSHSDAREDSTDGKVTPTKSQQHSRQGIQQQKRQAQKQEKRNKKKEENQKLSPQHSSKRPTQQQKRQEMMLEQQ